MWEAGVRARSWITSLRPCWSTSSAPGGSWAQVTATCSSTTAQPSFCTTPSRPESSWARPTDGSETTQVGVQPCHRQTILASAACSCAGLRFTVVQKTADDEKEKEDT